MEMRQPAADPANEELQTGRHERLTADQLFPGGRVLETPLGGCFVLDQVYSLSHVHGGEPVGYVPSLAAAPAAQFVGDPRLLGLTIGDFLFLDTETTGLYGAGTVAFMVGVAFFEDDALVVRQYFLRDYGDEPAMLHLLAGQVASRAGLITFNGRSFDLPLLANRYLLNRLDDLGADLPARPHIDLLLPARRLWRNRIGACSLSALEQNVLGLRRASQDVPGYLIPSLYFDYLRTGDARPLGGVFYHNRMDLLSMISLAAVLLRQFAQPSTADHPHDLLSLARWRSALGMHREAEEILRLALAREDLSLELYHPTLWALAALLKREQRRDEAVILWQQIAVTASESVEAHVELAKYYEWHLADPQSAHDWTRQALSLIGRLGYPATSLWQSQLQRRLARLERKLERLRGSG
jgi:uncharacterized protein YprB with RNaseH-like and TPR domain